LKKTLVVTLALLALGCLARADSFTTFPNRAAQNPTDFIDWSQLGPDGTELGTPQLVSSFNGNLALVGNFDFSNFFRVDEGTSWIGNFDYGENLIASGPGNNVPMLLVLQNPVGSVGFAIQADVYGPFTGAVEAFDTSLNPLFFYELNWISTNLENGSALFLGIGDESGVNIGAVEFGAFSGGGPMTAGDLPIDFAIDDPSFTYTPAVPEPSALAVLGSGLLSMGILLRRKLGA
jgi:PEP-CTERM motif